MQGLGPQEPLVCYLLIFLVVMPSVWLEKLFQAGRLRDTSYKSWTQGVESGDFYTREFPRELQDEYELANLRSVTKAKTGY